MLTSLAVRLAENNAVDSAILQLTATDLDLDANADYDYVIGDVTAYCADATGSGDDDVTSVSSRAFHVDSRSGVLSVRVSVDREEYSHFRITVLAVDHGLPPQTGSTIVEVVIDDVNDQQPMFLSPRNAAGNGNKLGLELAVAEDATDGQIVGYLKAIDRDATLANNRISYYFRFSQTPRDESAKYVVDTDTGEIRLIGRLDRERRSKYILAAISTEAALSKKPEVILLPVFTNAAGRVGEVRGGHQHGRGSTDRTIGPRTSVELHPRSCCG